MAKSFDPENWKQESRERWGVDRGMVEDSSKIKSLKSKNVIMWQRHTAREVARAIFLCQSYGKHSISEAAKLLNQQQGVDTWTYKRVHAFSKTKEAQKQFIRMSRQRDAETLHTKEELVRIITEALYFDKTSVYDVLPAWTDKETGQVHPPEYYMKPFDQWSDIARFAFDGMDWKTPKGRPPIAVPKFLSKEGLIDKAMRELGMLKERNVLENPDGSPFIVQIVKFSNQPTEQDGEK